MPLALTAAQRAEALVFAEAHSHLEIFLDSRQADSAFSIKQCFPPQSLLSETRAFRALCLASRLHVEAAQAPVDALAVFKIRDGASLFSCFTDASTSDLEDARLIADYLFLPRGLAAHVLAQLALLCLAADTSEGLAERLLAEPTLETFVQGGLDYIHHFMGPISETKSQQCALDWKGRLESAKLPLIRGLVGETLDEEAFDIDKGMHCCGRLFAGRDLPYSRLPSGSDHDDDGDRFPEVAVVAAALGKTDVLKRLEARLSWRIRGVNVVYAAACKMQEAVVDLASDEAPWTLRALLYGAARAGAAGVALLRDRPVSPLLTDMGIGQVKQEVVKELASALEDGLDIRPFVEFVTGSCKRAALDQEDLARLGLLDLLKARVQEGKGVVALGVLDKALEGGHAEVAEWCLANGATFKEEAESQKVGLAAVCKGFNGDVAALQYWRSKGAPCTGSQMTKLCEQAASMGSVAALGFVETLPHFEGWEGSLLGSVMSRAISSNQPLVLRWFASKYAGNCIPKSAITQDPWFGERWYAEQAAQRGDLELIKACEECLGYSFDHTCLGLVYRGASHRHVVDHLAAGLKKGAAISEGEEGWKFVARRFTREMTPSLQRLVDAGGTVPPVFTAQALAYANVVALDFIWANGDRDVHRFAKFAFLEREVRVLEWLMEKDRKGLAALSLDELKKLSPCADWTHEWADRHGPWKSLPAPASAQAPEARDHVGQKRSRATAAPASSSMPPANSSKGDGGDGEVGKPRVKTRPSGGCG